MAGIATWKNARDIQISTTKKISSLINLVETDYGVSLYVEWGEERDGKPM